MFRVFACVILWSFPLSTYAQDRAQSLADIRQDLNILYVEIQRLKGELSTTQGPSVSVAAGSVLERVQNIETELQRLTALSEELQFRVERVVQDGTNRVGDLEFRLVELEGGIFPPWAKQRRLVVILTIPKKMSATLQMHRNWRLVNVPISIWHKNLMTKNAMATPFKF